MEAVAPIEVVAHQRMPETPMFVTSQPMQVPMMVVMVMTPMHPAPVMAFLQQHGFRDPESMQDPRGEGSGSRGSGSGKQQQAAAAAGSRQQAAAGSGSSRQQQQQQATAAGRGCTVL